MGEMTEALKQLLRGLYIERHDGIPVDAKQDLQMMFEYSVKDAHARGREEGIEEVAVFVSTPRPIGADGKTLSEIIRGLKTRNA